MFFYYHLELNNGIINVGKSFFKKKAPTKKLSVLSVGLFACGQLSVPLDVLRESA